MVTTFAGHTDNIQDLAWSPDSRRIVSGGNDYSVKVWDSVSGEELFTYQASDFVLTVDWSSSGGYIAVARFNDPRPLILRAWAPGDELAETTWGIREPLASSPEVFPDVVLVPLLVFDAAGYRLGYGGGFYDRTLASLRRRKPMIAVGLAYDEQRIDAVPHCDYDERLDWVLTPSGPLRCNPSPRTSRGEG